MSSPSLLFPCAEDERISALLDAIQAQRPASFQLEGLCGSLPSVLIATAYESLKGQGKHLLILPNAEALNYCKEELQLMLPSAELHTLLPLDEKLGEQHSSALDRSRSIEALLRKKSAWVLALPPSLSLETHKEGQAHRLRRTLKQGKSLEIEKLCKELEASGFTETEEVLDPGTYALRGGLVDIFSYAHEQPLRLTFWGDELRRISFFDTQTQLSSQEVNEAQLLAHPDLSVAYVQRVPLYSMLSAGSCLWWMQSTSPAELGEAQEALLRSQVHVYLGGARQGAALRSLAWKSSSQPLLGDFKQMAEHFMHQQQMGYRLYISQSSTLQATRLVEILRNYEPSLSVDILAIGLHAGFDLRECHVLCYTDHELMSRPHLPRAEDSKQKSRFSLSHLQSLEVGDFVVHIENGIGRFAGLEHSLRQGKQYEMLRLVYKDNDLLYLSIHSLHKLSKYSSKEGARPRLSKLGSGDWHIKKSRAKNRLQEMAQELILMYAKRKAEPGYAFPSDSFAEAVLVSSFAYEDTPDQSTATSEVFHDMESPHPMDRLICGDVGFGKTEIAVRAAYKATRAGKQVAVLVPTTVLALQHYRSFSDRLRVLDVRIEHLHRFRSAQRRQEIEKQTKSAQIDILIGTSGLISEKINFSDLGLLIIDEEQKFGVRVKEKLRSLFPHIDILTLTATPIPRTLQFSLIGVRDVSILSTPPPRRQSIHTSLHRFDKELLQEAIQMELARKGQVFFVQNRVEQLDQHAVLLSSLVPEARIGLAHGQMKGDELEKSMYDFVKGHFDVLVCTNIIENGLDIANANTIIIQDAHQFGLSDLHQMRGRVGRSERKAFCYLITPAVASLSTQAMRRLSTLEAFTSLGDGYKLAIKDLDIRGSGNLLGPEQSGFMGELGFETYHKLLDEAVDELKKSDKGSDKGRTSSSMSLGESSTSLCAIETDLEAHISSHYISSGSTRMSYYKALGNCRDEKQLKSCRRELLDRFGELPEEIESLFESCLLRICGTSCGLSKIILKRSCLRCFFLPTSRPFSEPGYFAQLLFFVQKYSGRSKMSEEKEGGCLHFFEVNSFGEAIQFVREISHLSKKHKERM